MVTPSPSPSTFQQESTPSIVRSSPSVSPSSSLVISEVERENAIIVTLRGLTEDEVGYEEQPNHNLFCSYICILALLTLRGLMLYICDI